ncbi:PQQ-binding-like beta-propeller repeat protein [Spirillospora sp. CA-142024]|uniref:outer membrane protein assembly factor BamB family protein n=1 Tax=Spirillospora sp. CA-142024 TaxID=3240036 RepID=UPI003D92BF81
MTSRPRLLWGGALLAILLVVVVAVKACGGTGEEALPDGEKQPAPVAFGEKPLWDERKPGMERVAGVELLGDVAVVAGDVRLGGARLAVVDSRTGAPRWVVDAGYPLKGGKGATAHPGPGYKAEQLRGVTGKPVVYGQGSDWTVLVQYTKGGQGRKTETGVAALSGKDGSVRWKQALIRPRSGDDGDEDRDKKVRLLAADGRVLLTSVESKDGLDPKTIALDPATGRKLWENADGWAYRVSGDVVLGETRGGEAPSTWGEQRRDTDVFALDVRTGQRRWTLDGRFDASHLQAVAGRTAAVTVRETAPGRTYADERTVLADVATGKVVKGPRESGTSDLYGCADDGATLIACSGLSGRLVTIRTGGRGRLVAAKKQPFGDTMASVVMVWKDRIFIEGSSSDGKPERHAVVDRAANRLGSGPPGEIVAMSEGAAAFRVRRAGSTSSTPDGIVMRAAAAGAEPSEPTPPARPTLRPPRIDAAPLWTAGAGPAPARPPVKDTGLGSVISTEQAGDVLVYTGRERKDDHVTRQVVADVRTGEVRWSVRKGGSLGDGVKADFVGVPHIVGKGAEALSLVGYEGPGNEYGIAALSLKDGRLRWKKQVLSGDGYVLLEEADDDTFTVQASHGAQDEMVVYATGSRRELWRKRGVETASIGGGLVLATKTDQGDDWTVKHLDLIAYGASDGKRRWNLAGRYRDPRLLHDEGGKTVVIGTAEGGVVLDRATGRELAGTSAPLVRCDGDTDELIVCQAGAATGLDPGRRAVTIRTGGGVTKIHDLLETGTLTRYGAIGAWFFAVREPAVQGGAAQYLALDGEGRQIAANLPGRPVGIEGGYAVLMPFDQVRDALGEGAPGFTVHRIQG